MKDLIRSAQIVLPCTNLHCSLEFFVERLGFRVEMICPADAPVAAVISGYGTTLRLEQSEQSEPFTLHLLGDFSASEKIVSPDGVRLVFKNAESQLAIPEGTNEFVLSKRANELSSSAGRAGMRYRDLIPSRLGGRFIASHICLPDGGEVPDYVHFHKIRFQMIYCLSGWAKLVYEDQGEPFVMKAGDCVLQPPEIRHRVLECSDKLEVLEIACPAVHETFADHQLKLPNETLAPERIFGGQRFVHHIAEKSIWDNAEIEGFGSRDTGIYEATNGLADVRILRAARHINFSIQHSSEFLFFFVLRGDLRLSAGKDKIYDLSAGDSFVLPAGKEYSFVAAQGLEVIRIGLPSAG